jgi:hypothetical protein
MRHTKKMLLIPEAEYNALLGLMMKGGNELQNEKTMLDAKIANVLSDPKINAEIKQKKYNVLLKKRGQVRDLIENKPQKVVIENQIKPPPNVPPYMGLSNIAQTPQISESGNQAIIPQNMGGYDADKETVSSRSRSRRASRASQSLSSSALPSSTSEEEGPMKLSPTRKSELLKYVETNLQRFALQPDGTILSYRGPVKGSHYTQAIDYLSGKLDNPPRGYKFFENALKRDPITAKIANLPYKEQSGKGKHLPKKLVVVKIRNKKIIKTPGLERFKQKKVSFKPQIWEKL